MSFRVVVDGLNETSHHGASVAITGLAKNGVYSCEIPGSDPPAFIPCDNCEAGSASFSIDPTTIPYDLGADYYAVRVHMVGPKVAGTRTGCRQPPPEGTWTPGQNICGPGYQHPTYEGTVSGGDFLTFNGVTVAPSFEADWDAQHEPGSINNTVEINWPDFLFPAAWLVNPDPVWPFPDSEGNTFGQCLFTLAQMPTDPFTVEMVHFNHDQVQQGTWIVSIREYMIGETLPPPLRQTCIVGHA